MADSIEKILADKGAFLDTRQQQIENLLIRLGNGAVEQIAALTTALTIEQVTEILKPYGRALVQSLDAYRDLVPILRRMAKALGLPFRTTNTQNAQLFALFQARGNKIKAIRDEIARDLLRIALENKVAGNPSKLVIAELKAAVEVAGRRAGTEVQTALSMFDRATMANVYDEAGVERFVYFPPTLIETSRDSCTAVVHDERNISGVGFTRAEIAAMPDVDMIRGGAPYYNCRHEFIPAFGRVSRTREI